MKLNEIFQHKDPPLRRSSETSMLEAIDFIKTNCSEIVKRYKKSKSRIYRGIPGSVSDFYYGDPSTVVRQSKNTRNYYTLVMDNAAEWSKFPKRSESFICTSDPTYADDYGILTVAFPVDGTTIGICPGRDIWYVGEKRANGLDYGEINDLIHNFGSSFKVTINEKNYKAFKDDINKLGKEIKNNPEKAAKILDKGDKHVWSSGYRKKFIEKIVRNADNLYDFIESIFESKGFETQTTKNFDAPDNRELWFSGKCIFMYARNPIPIGPQSFDVLKKAGKTYDDLKPKDIQMSVNDFIKAL